MKKSFYVLTFLFFISIQVGSATIFGMNEDKSTNISESNNEEWLKDKPIFSAIPELDDTPQDSAGFWENVGNGIKNFFSKPQNSGPTPSEQHGQHGQRQINRMAMEILESDQGKPSLEDQLAKKIVQKIKQNPHDRQVRDKVMEYCVKNKLLDKVIDGATKSEIPPEYWSGDMPVTAHPTMLYDQPTVSEKNSSQEYPSNTTSSAPKHNEVQEAPVWSTSYPSPTVITTTQIIPMTKTNNSTGSFTASNSGQQNNSETIRAWNSSQTSSFARSSTPTESFTTGSFTAKSLPAHNSSALENSTQQQQNTGTIASENAIQSPLHTITTTQTISVTTASPAPKTPTHNFSTQPRIRNSLVPVEGDLIMQPPPQEAPRTIPVVYGGQVVQRLSLPPISPQEEATIKNRLLLELYIRQQGHTTQTISQPTTQYPSTSSRNTLRRRNRGVLTAEFQTTTQTTTKDQNTVSQPNSSYFSDAVKQQLAVMAIEMSIGLVKASINSYNEYKYNQIRYAIEEQAKEHTRSFLADDSIPEEYKKSVNEALDCFIKEENETRKPPWFWWNQKPPLTREDWLVSKNKELSDSYNYNKFAQQLQNINNTFEHNEILQPLRLEKTLDQEALNARRRLEKKFISHDDWLPLHTEQNKLHEKYLQERNKLWFWHKTFTSRAKELDISYAKDNQAIENRILDDISERHRKQQEAEKLQKLEAELEELERKLQIQWEQELALKEIKAYEEQLKQFIEEDKKRAEERKRRREEKELHGELSSPTQVLFRSLYQTYPEPVAVHDNNLPFKEEPEYKHDDTHIIDDLLFGNNELNKGDLILTPRGVEYANILSIDTEKLTSATGTPEQQRLGQGIIYSLNKASKYLGDNPSEYGAKVKGFIDGTLKVAYECQQYNLINAGIELVRLSDTFAPLLNPIPIQTIKREALHVASHHQEYLEGRMKDLAMALKGIGNFCFMMTRAIDLAHSDNFGSIYDEQEMEKVANYGQQLVETIEATTNHLVTMSLKEREEFFAKACVDFAFDGVGGGSVIGIGKQFWRAGKGVLARIPSTSRAAELIAEVSAGNIVKARSLPVGVSAAAAGLGEEAEIAMHALERPGELAGKALNIMKQEGKGLARLQTKAQRNPKPRLIFEQTKKAFKLAKKSKGLKLPRSAKVTIKEFIGLKASQLSLQYPKAAVNEALRVLNFKHTAVIAKTKKPLKVLGEVARDIAKIDSNPRWKQFRFEPAEANKCKLKNIHEAIAGIACEEQGLLYNLARDLKPTGGEFIDHVGKTWDVKTPISRALNSQKVFNTEKGLSKFVASINRTLEKGKNIIISLYKLEESEHQIVYDILHEKLSKTELERIIIIDIVNPQNSKNTETLLKLLGF